MLAAAEVEVDFPLRSLEEAAFLSSTAVDGEAGVELELELSRTAGVEGRLGVPIPPLPADAVTAARALAAVVEAAAGFLERSVLS